MGQFLTNAHFIQLSLILFFEFFLQKAKKFFYYFFTKQYNYGIKNYI